MKVIKYNTKHYGIRHGLLVAEGRKWSKLILIEHPVRVQRIPNTELKRISDTSYQPRKALKLIKQMAKTYYGTVRNAPKSLRVVLR